MEFWSEGLGKRTLVVDFKKSTYDIEGEEEIIKGIVDAPADWNYTVRVARDDWVRILEIATSSDVVGFLANGARIGVLIRMGWFIMKLLVLVGAFSIGKVVGRGKGKEVKRREYKRSTKGVQ